MTNGRKEKEVVMVLEAETKAVVPIIESCAAAGLHVIAGSSKRYCCGFYCHGTRQRVIYPSPELKPDECIDEILGFLKRRRIDVLFPAGDLMTYLVAKRQDQFRRFTRMVLPPYEVFMHGRDKTLTLKAAARAGCPIPLTWYPQEQDLQQIAREASYPVLIKPAVGHGARGITFCRTADELISNYRRIETDYGQSFVQEYVPQTGMQYKVDVILDGSQNLLAGVVYAKLRYYPPTGGSSVLNKTEHRPDILESALKTLRQLKWVGFCDFDFITDPRDNVVKLMEINPRFPESYRATVAAGVDMTRILYRLAKGETVQPQLAYDKDRYVRFLFGDIMWFLTTRSNRWTARPSFFDFFRSDMMYQLVRANDFGPVMGYLLANLSLLWDKQAREFRLRFRNVQSPRPTS